MAKSEVVTTTGDSPQLIALAYENHADAANDIQAVNVFLDSYKRHSVHTQRAYKKEVAKFMLWLAVMAPRRTKQHSVLASVTIDDANSYMDFLVEPSEIAPDVYEKFDFKKSPFSRLHGSSRQLALSVLSRLYDSLMHYVGPSGSPYCQRNPFHDVHVGAEKLDGFVEKALTPDEWKLVIDAIEQLPQVTPRERDYYHRARWVFQLLYRSFLRRDEASKLLMSDFFHDGKGWLIRVLGKGSKRANIVATQRLMDELAIYRESLGLPGAPSANEKFPAILPLTGWRPGLDTPPSKPLSNQLVYGLCTEVFRHAAGVARKLAMEDASLEAAATRLARATPHWMRHTGVSHAMESNVSPRYVQAQARHSSLKVTARYDHKRRDKWRNELDEMD